jgi:hypothetical protein
MEVEVKRVTRWKLQSAAMVLAASGQCAFAMPANLPPVQHQGDVTFLTGGIGLSESTAIKDAMHKYPLTLEFAGKAKSGNEYLSDVSIQVSDKHGYTVLKTIAKGPFLLALLPNGRYAVTASYNGKTEHRDVNITPSSHVRELFLWPL